MSPVDQLDDVFEYDPEVVGPAATLNEFLALPDIEEAPAWEFVDGRMVRKVSPKRKHITLQDALADFINDFSEPAGLGTAFPELRCTFGGRSIVPDVVFQTTEHIEFDDEGDVTDDVFVPPDLMVEIVSPRQSPKLLEDRIHHALAQGCPLGWLVHTYRRTITVYRPGAEPVELGLDGVLEGEPVLPGFRLPVAEVFAWLKLRRRGGGP